MKTRASAVILKPKKNQVKLFKFERCFLDLMDFYSSNFSEDWIRIRIHLKTKMAIAEIKIPMKVPGRSFVIGRADTWARTVADGK